MKKKLILFPLTILAGLLATSCSQELAVSSHNGNVGKTPWVDYDVKPTGVSFKSGDENITIEKGSTYKYEYTVTPKGSTGASLVWTSANESIATVSDGVVTALAGGQTTITVSEESAAFDPITLKVNVTVAISSFEVTPPDLAKNDQGEYILDWNKEYNFATSFTPSDTTYTDLVWSVKNVEEPKEGEEEKVIATATNGVVTTYQETGSVVLTVSSYQLPEASKTFKLNIADRKIHVKSIALALESGKPSEVEVGTYSKVVATIDPSNAEDAAQLKYYSRDPNVASVDPDTGVITGVSEGTARIFANCEGVDSNDVTVTVFEVHAKKIIIDKLSDIIVTNDEGGSKTLSVSYETDREGYTKPSVAKPVFSTEDKHIVTVSENGVVSAVNGGTATIKVSIAGVGDNVFTDTVTVTSKVYVTSVSISGPNSCYFDETATLTASVTPNKAEDAVTWSANPASKVNLVAEGNSVTVHPLGIEGPVTITATSDHNNISATHVISLSERPVLFEKGTIYLVGNKQFNTGTSIEGSEASWSKAKYAFKFTEEYPTTEEGVAKQYKGTIYFHKGDEWKLRDGPEDTDYKDIFYYEGENQVWNYELAGAFDYTHMKPANVPSDNVIVLQDGLYDIYYKIRTDGSFRVYIAVSPTLTLSHHTLTMGVDDETTIIASQYKNTVTFTSSDETTVKILKQEFVQDVGTVATIKGLAVGSATINAEDEGGYKDSCKVTVKSEASGVTSSIYLNAYGLFDTDGVVPFVHAYNSSTTDHTDLKMSLVSGQSMVYTADISADYDGAIFVRMPKGSTELDWTKAYGQTNSADALFGKENMFTMSGYKTVDEKEYIAGSWSTFDSTITYKTPADYCLIGSINSWAAHDQDLAFEKVSAGEYRIHGIELNEGDVIKVISRDGKYISNAEEWDNCHFTLTDDGYGGKNIVVKETHKYIIDFYEVDSYGKDNHVVLTYDDGQVVYNHKYYVEGIGGAWSINDEYGLNADSSDTNHYYLNHVTLEANTEIKVYSVDEDKMYGIKTASESDAWTVTAEGNLKVKETDTYSINFYVSVDNDNYISLYSETKNAWKDGTAYLVGSIDFTGKTDKASWNDVTKAFAFTEEGGDKAEDVFKQYYAKITLAADDEFRIRIGSEYQTIVETDQGAFKNGQMATSGDNYVVKKAGEYEFYMKQKNNGYWSCYVAANYDESVTTDIEVTDKTGKGFTYYGCDIKLHIYDITFASGSPITTVQGLKDADVKIGEETIYNVKDSIIDVKMSWKSNDDGVTYAATLPGYIESCKICVYNTNDAWVHQVEMSEGFPTEAESHVISVTKNYSYHLYLFNNENPEFGAYFSGDGKAFYTPLSLVANKKS